MKILIRALALAVLLVPTIGAEPPQQGNDAGAAPSWAISTRVGSRSTSETEAATRAAAYANCAASAAASSNMSATAP